MKTDTTYKITGNDAVRLAFRDHLTTYCYANPIDDGGVVPVEVAQQIAKEDPNLVYVKVQEHGDWMRDGRVLSESPEYFVEDYFNDNGMYLGPDPFGVEPRWDDAPGVEEEA